MWIVIIYFDSLGDGYVLKEIKRLMGSKNITTSFL